jgi:hypothetical protein
VVQKTKEIMDIENKVRVGFCEHTQNEVVQEKFGDEWICIHEDTREQELENIKQVKQQIRNYV